MYKSFINYQGGKYRLLKQILPLFPEKIDTFVELFAGSAVITENINIANQYIINDKSEPLMKLLSYVISNDPLNIISDINYIIDYYGLSNTFKNGYEYYDCNSSSGLSQYNKNSYKKLRDDFNNNNYLISEECMFYTLIIFGFNNQIRFNQKGDFNNPVGKRDFNKMLQEKLIQFHEQMNRKELTLFNTDYKNIPIKSNYFIYVDPPYLISTATYNENLQWTEDDDNELMRYLDILDRENIKFAFSNVLEHKGIKNENLISWANKYNIHQLNKSYKNSNYQSNKSNYVTKEVLITNY